MKPLSMTAIICLFSALPAWAQHNAHQASPYAGQQDREIKSLSATDLETLRRGGGWGLAKAAELNGVPGPLHLLELKDEIALTSEQIAAIEAVFEQMQKAAIAEGAQLIQHEKALEQAFQERKVTAESLKTLLEAIGSSRTKLRYIHLSAHLETPKILTEAQINHYNALRGYGKSDPCTAIPHGHDPVMWRMHNGCD